MPRPTNISSLMTTSSSQAKRAAEPRASMSDAKRAARGRAQIDAGQYLDDDRLDVFLDGLRLPTTEA